jgi:hypothetical protein
MENLFLEAMGTDVVEKINRIKKNKQFANKLISDLQNVYTIYVSNRDDTNSTIFNIKKFSNNIDTIFITANEKGITFRTKMLGYRKCNTPSWELGWITDKYDTCKGDANFMREGTYLGTSTHGFVEVVINFTDYSANLMDIIRDITRILDYEKVAKRF